MAEWRASLQGNNRKSVLETSQEQHRQNTIREMALRRQLEEKEKAKKEQKEMEQQAQMFHNRRAQEEHMKRLSEFQRMAKIE